MKGNAAAHTTNAAYREGWERVFEKRCCSIEHGPRDSQRGLCACPCHGEAK